jgi:hypothetical protein
MELLNRFIRNAERKMLCLNSEDGKTAEYNELLRSKTLLEEILEDIRSR